MAELGLHPRLARALLDGAAAVGARAAAEVVALLDDDTLAAGVDVDTELARLRSGAAPRLGPVARREVTRLRRLVGAGPAAAERGTRSAAARWSSRWPTRSGWPARAGRGRGCT